MATPQPAPDESGYDRITPAEAIRRRKQREDVRVSQEMATAAQPEALFAWKARIIADHHVLLQREEEHRKDAAQRLAKAAALREEARAQAVEEAAKRAAAREARGDSWASSDDDTLPPLTFARPDTQYKIGHETHTHQKTPKDTKNTRNVRPGHQRVYVPK